MQNKVRRPKNPPSSQSSQSLGAAHVQHVLCKRAGKRQAILLLRLVTRFSGAHHTDAALLDHRLQGLAELVEVLA